MKPFLLAKLGPLTSLISSGSTPLGGSSRYLAEGPVMFVRSQNVRMNCLDLSDVVYIDSALHEEMKRTQVRSGDVFINITGASIGRVAAFDLNGDMANVNQHVCIIRPKPELLDFRYLASYLCSPPFQEIINRLQRGGTRQALTFDMIANFDIPLPPLPEQRRIAAILDKADAIRRKREEGIRLTEELLRSTFLEMFGDPVANPKGWDQVKLDALCHKVVDCPHSTPIYTDQTGGYPCVRSSDIQDGYFDWSTTKYVPDDEYMRRIQRHTPSPGDVVYCREGARFGNVARVPEGLKLCLGQRMMLFQAELSVATNEFIWALLDCPRMYHEAQRRVGGSASPHVNVKDIKQFLVVKPPLSLQLEFSRIVRLSDQMRLSRKKAAAHAEMMFASLFQRAFGGDL